MTTQSDPWDTSWWFHNARSQSTSDVAAALRYIANAGWGEQSFEISNAQDETELAVTYVPLDARDVDPHILGSLADCVFDEDAATAGVTCPPPGHYVVTVNSDGIPTGYEYATRTEALRDYNALRARF